MATAPSLDSVPGWLDPIDTAVLAAILDAQTARGVTGDVVELGVYEGRTSIHLARHLSDGERLVACDLFELAQDEESIPEYVRAAYVDLSQARFEANYLRFHEALPTVVRGSTADIGRHVDPATVRLVHVDASHRFEHVRTDAESAKTMLIRDGVAVFDDYRNHLAPGTAAAVWGAVATTALRPICVTPTKFYGTWGDPDPIVDDLIAAIGHHRAWQVERLELDGSEYVRVAVPKPASAQKRTDAERERSSTGVRRVLGGLGRWTTEFGHRIVRFTDQDDLGRATRRSVGVRVDSARARLRRRLGRS